MSAVAVRELLLRLQTDTGFAEQFDADIDEAVADYDLTEPELELVRNPTWSLQRYLVPPHRLAEGGPSEAGVAPFMEVDVEVPPFLPVPDVSPMEQPVWPETLPTVGLEILELPQETPLEEAMLVGPVLEGPIPQEPILNEMLSPEGAARGDDTTAELVAQIRSVSGQARRELLVALFEGMRLR